METRAADTMRRTLIILGAIALIGLITLYLVQRAGPQSPLDRRSNIPKSEVGAIRTDLKQSTNALGDILVDAQDAAFLGQVFPKVQEFFASLDRLGLSPLQHAIQPGSCSKVRLIKVPDGTICRFVIDDGWTATFIQNSTNFGLMHFGQRGPDNPYRAISHADTNTLRRLSQGAIKLPETEVRRIANTVTHAFDIDASKFEKPEIFEEGLFEHRLGIYTVRFRKKGSDPINQLNYTRSFSLKATSPTTAVLVSYSHL